MPVYPVTSLIRQESELTKSSRTLYHHLSKLLKYLWILSPVN